MLTVNNNKINLRQFFSRILLIIASILLIFVCLNAKTIYYTSQFFFSMESLQLPINLGSDAQVTDVYLADLKQIARFVLSKSIEDRRNMIVFYGNYININTSVSGRYGERAINLYLLQRLIFDVPQKLPMDRALRFAPLLWSRDNAYFSEGYANVLWPFVYENYYLTIKEGGYQLRGDYDGAGEYDYFFRSFDFRSLDAVK